MIDDQGIGNHGIDGTVFIGNLALTHAVADDLTAAKFHLFAIDGKILFDFDDERCISKTNTVACGGAKHIGIGSAGKNGCHCRCPLSIAA